MSLALVAAAGFAYARSRQPCGDEVTSLSASRSSSPFLDAEEQAQQPDKNRDELVRTLAADPARMSLGKLWEVSAAIGSPLRWPAALLLALLGLLCFRCAATARFTRKLDLLGLMREQAKTFRTTAAFVERQLGLVPPRDGEPRPADPALHPDEWIARYAKAADGGYDVAAAHAELSRQLGPLWHGVGHAAGHVRVLYAAFALHLQQRRTASLGLLGDMAEALWHYNPSDAYVGAVSSYARTMRGSPAAYHR